MVVRVVFLGALADCLVTLNSAGPQTDGRAAYGRRNLHTKEGAITLRGSSNFLDVDAKAGRLIAICRARKHRGNHLKNTVGKFERAAGQPARDVRLHTARALMRKTSRDRRWQCGTELHDEQEIRRAV